jgi:hypothetical protein
MRSDARVSVARCAVQNGASHAPLILGLFALLLAAALASTPALAAERFELAGSHVAVYNLVGEVELVPSSGRAVVVHVTRGGEDAARLGIERGPIREIETLRVIYPSSRIRYDRGISGWGSTTTVRVGEDGRFGDRDGRLSRGKVTISGNGSGLDAHADLRIEVPKGQKLELYLAVGEASARNIDGDIVLDVSAADVTTESTRGNLLIDVGSGAVTVNGAEGDVNIDTGSGSVDVTKIRGAALLIDTGSGAVSGVDIAVQRLNVDTGSGGVDLGAVSARDILVDTGSGRVQIDLTSDVESLNVDTGSGGVTVRVPQTLGAEVFVETGSGGFRSDVEMDITMKNRDSVRGRIGDGRGRIVIETGSGGVRFIQG